MSRIKQNLKPEELVTERMLADVRLILSLTSAAVVLKLMSEVQVDTTTTIISLSLLLLYSIAMRLIVQFRPKAVRAAAIVSSLVEVWLITYLIWVTWYSYTSISPFYMWYVFYVVSISSRYGKQYAILGLAASIVLYTAVSLSPRNPVVFVPGFLGSTGFLFVLAFLFGHMSERQRNYQKQLLVANEFALHMASLPSSREMIEYLLVQTGELLESEMCWFVQYRDDEEGGVSIFSHGIDFDANEVSEAFGEWSPNLLLKNAKVAVSNNLLQEDRMPAGTVHKLGLKSLAAMPVFVRDEPLGVLYAANHPPHGFSRYDLQLLELLTTQAAPMIENSQLWEKLKDSAAAEERLRIARDLHDNFLQTLAAIKLHLERCRLVVDKDTDKAKTTIVRIHEIATQGLAEVRAYLSALRLMGPEPARLGQAISRSVEEVASRAACESHVVLDIPEGGVPPQVSLAVFQIVRELLNNTAKHAKAENIWVSAKRSGNSIEVELRDDGVGFEPPSDLRDLAAQGHLGLMGIQERVQAVGGSLTVNSARGSGTTVMVRIPVPGQ